jgi:4-hydroxy-tetrahydrodipicolinate synthase
MNEYTRLAFEGRFAEARAVRDSLDPVREAIRSTKPPGKPQAHGKYWQELLGQTGGYVRPPLLQLTEEEKPRGLLGIAERGAGARARPVVRSTGLPEGR